MQELFWLQGIAPIGDISPLFGNYHMEVMMLFGNRWFKN
jgi:hypothetical protein